MDNSVQGIKEELVRKQAAAEAATPEGMQFVGWALDGWVTTFPLLDSNAGPVYAFLQETKEVEGVVSEELIKE